MKITQALPTHVEQICTIMEAARASLAALGIDQWQNGSPNRAQIEQDIAQQNGYVLIEEERLLAYCYISQDEEATYRVTEHGSWSRDDAHLVIHRVMVHPDARRKNCAGTLMDFAAELAQQAGCSHLRIDTHEGNLPMQRMLQKQGFSHCAIVHLADGAARMAFEKLL